VPIVHATGGLKDSVEQYEPGAMGGILMLFPVLLLVINQYEYRFCINTDTNSDTNSTLMLILMTFLTRTRATNGASVSGV